MEQIENWGEALMASLQNVLTNVLDYLPTLLAALVVLIIGILIAAALGKLVKKLVRLTRVDVLVNKLGVNKVFKGVGNVTIAGILGWLVKWFLIIVVFIAVADILNFPQIIEFLQEVVAYIPHVIAAVLILLVGFIGGNFVYEVVYRAVKTAKMHAPKLLANLAKWAIVIFAFMAALIQLKIAATLIEILFIGIIAMFALAGGLAFGLGGKEHASQWIDDMKKRF